MKQSAVLAREHHLHLHTHLAETQDEDAFCLQKFGHKPVAYMQSLDWVGEDVWFAHSVHVKNEEIQVYRSTGCGVAHCPSSNMRLASGIAPVREYMESGVKLGLGVDGSASNDGSHMLGEARQAMLLARLRAGIEGASLSSEDAPPILTAREALELATRGGAAVLGRNDIGSLEAGKCADLIAINLDRLEYTGALHDPVAAAVFCAPVNVDYNIVGGKFIVRKGELITLDLHPHIEHHNRAAKRLLEG
jgi:8-oxoguanine deaminase